MDPPKKKRKSNDFKNSLVRLLLSDDGMRKCICDHLNATTAPIASNPIASNLIASNPIVFKPIASIPIASKPTASNPFKVPPAPLTGNSVSIPTSSLVSTKASSSFSTSTSTSVASSKVSSYKTSGAFLPSGAKLVTKHSTPAVSLVDFGADDFFFDDNDDDDDDDDDYKMKPSQAHKKADILSVDSHGVFSTPLTVDVDIEAPKNGISTPADNLSRLVAHSSVADDRNSIGAEKRHSVDVFDLIDSDASPVMVSSKDYTRTDSIASYKKITEIDDGRMFDLLVTLGTSAEKHKNNPAEVLSLLIASCKTGARPVLSDNEIIELSKRNKRKGEYTLD